MTDKLLVPENPQVRKVAQRLHYIDYFYEQRQIPTDWDELTKAQRNKYLNYTLKLLKIWEERKKAG